MVTDNTIQVTDNTIAQLPNPKPRVKLSGQNGNVFNLLGLCNNVLRSSGNSQYVEELNKQVFRSHSYDEALAIMADYCEIR